MAAEAEKPFVVMFYLPLPNFSGARTTTKQNLLADFK